MFKQLQPKFLRLKLMFEMLGVNTIKILILTKTTSYI